VASEQDAARDRVLAARAALASELETLEASGRAAVDIPARIRQSPAKAAAVAGGIAFVLLRGPQRLFGAARRAIFGKPAPMPKGLLPKEIEKTLHSMGDDGDKVRGTLERDFAEYVKKAQRDRRALRTFLLIGVARPMLERGMRRAVEYLLSPSPEGFSTRLEEVRARAAGRIGQPRNAAEPAAEGTREQAERAAEATREGAESAAAAAKEQADRAAEAARDRVERVRGSGAPEGEDESPTGI
jgi:hypothetical protein